VTTPYYSVYFPVASTTWSGSTIGTSTTFPFNPPSKPKDDAVETWDVLDRNARHLDRVLLYGPPGTGKTWQAQRAGLDKGVIGTRIPLTEDTPAVELRGHHVPVGGGEFAWMDGPALACFRNGGRLVLDEITRATDDCLSFCLALLDDPESAYLTLPNREREVIHRHPEFTVWATSNDKPSALSDALADRFTVRVHCTTVNPDALKSIPAILATAVRNGMAGGPDSISYRQASEYLRLRSHDIAAQEAAFLIWGQRGRDIIAALKIADLRP
jgi:AAA domain (dynein-related subfamily)